MRIDIFTVMATSITLVMLLACQFVFYWLQDRRSNWLAWFVVPFILAGGGLALTVARWKSGDFLAIGVANVFLIAAFGFIWQGVRVFERRQPILWPLVALAAVWLALCFWPVFSTNLGLRVAAISAVAALFCGLAAWELWRGRPEKLVSRVAACTVMASYTLFMLLRIAFVGVLPFPVGGLPIDATWIGVFNLIVFTHIATFAILMISLTKERRELEQRNDAMTDPLTGMFNRRAFTARARRSAHGRKYGRERTTILVLDLDHFKSVNDRFGHDVGDRMLIAFAAVADGALPGDELYRLGGEEFCFILRGTNLAEAITVAERIRDGFALVSLDAAGEQVRATVSIGIATTEYSGFDLEALLAAADGALYEAKARGRNRIVVAEPTPIKAAHSGYTQDWRLSA